MTDTIQLRKRLWEKKKKKQFQQFSWRSSSARKISESASFSFVYSQHSNNPSAKGNHPEWKMNVRPFMGMDSTTQSKKNRNYKKKFSNWFTTLLYIILCKKEKKNNSSGFPFGVISFDGGNQLFIIFIQPYEVESWNTII